MAKDNDVMLIGPETKKILDKVTNELKPGSLLSVLKTANANRNRQVHRLSSNTKRGRQFLAKETKPLGTQTLRETNARESRKLPDTRPDVVIYDDIIIPNSEGNIRSNK